MSEQTNEEGVGGSRFAVMVRRAALLPEQQWTDERIGVVARTIAPREAGAAEIAMFLAVANRYQLDPFTREIWLAKDQGRLIILTGRDSFLKVARRHVDYLGYESGAVYEKDEFVAVRKGGDVVIAHSVVGIERGALLGAYCKAQKEGHPPQLIMRRFDDYKHLHEKNNWQNFPEDMLLARVITVAHRLLFNISGLHTPEEMESGEASETLASHEVAAKTKDRLQALKDKVQAQTGKPEAPAKAPEPAKEEASGFEQAEGEHESARGRFWALYRELGYSTDVIDQEERRHAWTERHTGKRSMGQMSTEELRQLVALLEVGKGPGREEQAVEAAPGSGLPFSDD